MAWHWTEGGDDFYQQLVIAWVLGKLAVGEGEGDAEFLIHLFQRGKGFLCLTVSFHSKDFLEVALKASLCFPSPNFFATSAFPPLPNIMPRAEER